MGPKEKDLFNAKKKDPQHSIDVHTTFVPDCSRAVLPAAFTATKVAV